MYSRELGARRKARWTTARTPDHQRELKRGTERIWRTAPATRKTQTNSLPRSRSQESKTKVTTMNKSGPAFDRAVTATIKRLIAPIATLTCRGHGARSIR
jgi:hypothetical protein